MKEKPMVKLQETKTKNLQNQWKTGFFIQVGRN